MVIISRSTLDWVSRPGTVTCSVIRVEPSGRYPTAVDVSGLLGLSGLVSLSTATATSSATVVISGR